LIEMKTIFILAFAANIVLMVVGLAILPAQVAIQFGPGGAPVAWAGKLAYTIVFLAIEVLLFLLLLFAPGLNTRLPAWMVNLPNKAYWLREENRPALKAKLGRVTAQIGTALYAFLFCAGLLAIEANLARPVRLLKGPFFVALGLFLGYTALWSIALFWSFRVPDDGGPRVK